MTHRRISTTVTQSVVLVSQQYGSTLTITTSGSVVPAAANNAAGILGNEASDRVTNHGTVFGAQAAYNNGNGGSGGAGIDLTAGGEIKNSGAIMGGSGAYSSDYRVVCDGGNGVSITGGLLKNSGTITGGDRGGSNQGRSVSLGGTGVYATGAPLNLNNSGHIIGGYGGYSGTGGVGVDLTTAGTIHNAGIIQGGYSYKEGGVGVELAASSMLVNAATIEGADGNTGIMATDSRIYNSGSILGGGSNEYGSSGGIGLSVTGGVLNNTGDIAGGFGGVTRFYHASPAGAGVVADGTVITNSGTIDGGRAFGSSYGGAGVALTGSGSLTNHGTISGGSASYSLYGTAKSEAGVGVSIASGARGSSSGLIQGGSSGNNYGEFGPAGGAGVSLGTESAFNNTGTIAGGAGAYGSFDAGAGGDGVDINGGTMTTSGTISGGIGGSSPDQAGISGDAVSFGIVAGTLIIDPGAVFDGNIAGLSTVNDTIVLAGSASGTLAGFGTTVTGIMTIDEKAGGIWTLQGSISGQGTIDIGKGADLSLTGGAVSISSVVFAHGGNETLVLGSPSSFTSTLSDFGSGDQIDLKGVKATSLSYANGTLTLFGSGHSTVATLTFAGNYSTADFSLEEKGGTAEVFYAGTPTLYVQDFLAPGIVPDARVIQTERLEALAGGNGHVPGNIADWHFWPALHA